MMSPPSKIREIAAAVVFDTSGNLLLQLRDDIPGILYPGKIGLFGGHREGDETFLNCVVREVHEELSLFIPQARFELIAQRTGADTEVPGGTVHGEFFVTRDVPVDKIFVTEGRLKIVHVSDLAGIESELTPSALLALNALALL
jgi:8-oxo-dGTP diphosphatase